MTIRPVTTADQVAWLDMRQALWPEATVDDLRDEIACSGGNPDMICLVADQAGLVGFVEASLRSVADGCDSSPVGYVEGWYVAPAHRGLGVGRRLVEAAQDWARSRGCTEMASDAEISNPGSIDAHRRLGFEEVSRVVTLRKSL
jgi:aminoglycoside 6'-N-acetyltransferase I